HRLSCYTAKKGYQPPGLAAYSDLKVTSRRFLFFCQSEYFDKSTMPTFRKQSYFMTYRCQRQGERLTRRCTRTRQKRGADELLSLAIDPSSNNSVIPSSTSERRAYGHRAHHRDKHRHRVSNRCGAWPRRPPRLRHDAQPPPCTRAPNNRHTGSVTDRHLAA